MHATLNLITLSLINKPVVKILNINITITLITKCQLIKLQASFNKAISFSDKQKKRKGKKIAPLRNIKR